MASRILFVILIVFTACRPVKYIYHPATAETKPAEAGEKILAMAFSISADSSGSSSISLISKTISDGHLKSEPGGAASPYCLKGQLTDDASAVLKTFYIEHPLFKSVEYAGEQNQFVRRMIAAKKSEFFIRVPFSPALHFLKLEEFRDSKSIHSSQFELR